MQNAPFSNFLWAPESESRDGKESEEEESESEEASEEDSDEERSRRGDRAGRRRTSSHASGFIILIGAIQGPCH
jgi:hypothetical protein